MMVISFGTQTSMDNDAALFRGGMPKGEPIPERSPPLYVEGGVGTEPQWAPSRYGGVWPEG